jgi:hypothetical protein
VIVRCVSLLKNGLYNDTIGVQVKESKANNLHQSSIQSIEPGAEAAPGVSVKQVNLDTFVTYNNQETLNMTHSGDKKDGLYGLEHVVEVKPVNFNPTFVISAPWKNSNPEKVSTLIPTNPILEICAENNPVNPADEPELKRYVIPQDYANSDNFTACVNAEITYDQDTLKWCVKIRRDFIMGFADNTTTLISEVKKLQ